MFKIFSKAKHAGKDSYDQGKPGRKGVLFALVLCSLILPYPVVNALDASPVHSTTASSNESDIKPAESSAQINTHEYNHLASFCDGAYANNLGVLSPASKKVEENAKYSFCVRSTAVYQCPYYNSDGVLQTRRETKVAHGTAFAFRTEGNHAYLLTNEHVTEWPLVSTRDTPVENIPLGCRRISQSAVIVDNEDDAYAVDDITAKHIVADPELDLAILKAPLKVGAIPFVLGQSASLEVGDIVSVRGFPLGEFQAVNVGRVVNPSQHDVQGQWNHDDFVIDAQLSEGQSGSPVLAVSCRTHQLELVGVYHAGFVGGQGMNVAVGIDEFREMLATFKPRVKSSVTEALRSEDRTRLLAELKNRQTLTTFISYGNFTVGVRIFGEKIYFDIFSKHFPVSDWRHMILEDLPSESFGSIGRLWFGNESGLREKMFSELTPGEQGQLSTLINGLRHRLHQTLQLRQLEVQALQSRRAYDRLRILQRQMGREKNITQARMLGIIEWTSKFAQGPNESPAKNETAIDEK